MSRKIQILIVEDEMIIGQNIRKGLERSGYYVIGPIGDAEIALKTTLEKNPDLILMDINLGGEKDGVDVVQELNKQVDIPVIYITAHGDNDTIERAKQTAPYGYLHKPFGENEIHSAIEMALYKHESQREINRRENILSSMLRSIDDALVATDANYHINYVNPIAEELFGKSAVDLLGKKIESICSFVHEQSGDSIKNTCRKVIETGERSLLPDDCILVNFNDKRIPVSGSLSAIQTNKGKSAGVVFVLRDVSGRKQVERDLIRARDSAEEMNRVKTALLANMSHEMRTPLTGILGFASILESDLPEGEARDMAMRINLSGRRLLETIESILDLAKLESEKVETQPEQINLVEEINRALDIHSRPARHKGLSLRVYTDLEELYVEIDRQLFNRIMYNLLSNALKYTEEGEVSVHISRLRKSGLRYVQVDVQDTGVGISPEFLPRVFDEFQQESTGLSRKFEGSGLGLTISRKLVEVMGGSISVNSKKGEGSIFSILLPLNKEDNHMDADEFQGKISGDKVQKPQILLVEDDYDSSVITRFYLGRDCEVIIVDSGEKAIEMLHSKNFQLVIMDISLGAGMDGVSTLKAMRSNSLLVDTPVIALTAHALSGDADYYLNEGFTGYLSKPFKKDELLQLVGKLIRN